MEASLNPIFAEGLRAINGELLKLSIWNLIPRHREYIPPENFQEDIKSIWNAVAQQQEHGLLEHSLLTKKTIIWRKQLQLWRKDLEFVVRIQLRIALETFLENVRARGFVKRHLQLSRRADKRMSAARAGDQRLQVRKRPEIIFFAWRLAVLIQALSQSRVRRQWNWHIIISNKS